jgi:hypothetical protein
MQRSDEERQERGRALTGLVAGALIVLGSFLPWITLSTGFGNLGKNGMEGGDGVITMILGILVLLVSLARLSGSDLPGILVRSPLAAGAVVGLIAVVNFMDIQDRVSGFESEAGGFGTGSVGAGIYALFVGAILALIAGLGKKMEGSSAVLTRECPHCKSQIRADASVCPMCQRESAPWVRQGDTWWRQDETGDYWFDPKQRRWNRYEAPAQNDQSP